MRSEQEFIDDDVNFFRQTTSGNSAKASVKLDRFDDSHVFEKSVELRAVTYDLLYLKRITKRRIKKHVCGGTRGRERKGVVSGRKRI